MLNAMLLSGSQQSALLVLCCQLEEKEEVGSDTLSPLEVADKLDLLPHSPMAGKLYTVILQNEH